MFIDIIAIILAVFGFYSGYKRGIIDAIFDMLSIFIAVVAALKLAPITIRFLDSMADWSEPVNFIVGFVATFFIIMLGIRLIGSQIEKIMKTMSINFLNKFAGGVLLSFVLVTIFSGALWLTDEMTLLPENVQTGSTSYPILEQIPSLATGLISAMKPMFMDFWELLQSAIESVKERGEAIQ